MIYLSIEVSMPFEIINGVWASSIKTESNKEQGQTQNTQQTEKKIGVPNYTDMRQTQELEGIFPLQYH